MQDLGKDIAFPENYKDLIIPVKTTLSNICHVIQMALLVVFDQSLVPLS